MKAKANELRYALVLIRHYYMHGEIYMHKKSPPQTESMSRLIADYQQFWSYTILRIIYKTQSQTPLTNHKTRCLAIHISGPHTDERLWWCDTAWTLRWSFSNTWILQQDSMLSHSQNRRGGVRVGWEELTILCLLPKLTDNYLKNCFSLLLHQF